MEFKELLEFIDYADEKIREKFSRKGETKQEIIFSRTVKLMEELGELSNEILASNGDQRDEKLAKSN